MPILHQKFHQDDVTEFLTRAGTIFRYVKEREGTLRYVKVRQGTLRYVTFRFTVSPFHRFTVPPFHRSIVYVKLR